MTTSRIRAWYQNPKKHLILAQFRNSPWTGVERYHPVKADRWAVSKGTVLFDPPLFALTKQTDSFSVDRQASGSDRTLDRLNPSNPLFMS
jgi:hypothetical protein